MQVENYTGNEDMRAIWLKNHKKQFAGTLSLHNEQLSFFDQQDRRIYALERVWIKFIGPDGMMFSGFELTGIDKTGKSKYQYVEAYFRCSENGKSKPDFGECAPRDEDVLAEINRRFFPEETVVRKDAFSEGAKWMREKMRETQ